MFCYPCIKLRRYREKAVAVVGGDLTWLDGVDVLQVELLAEEDALEGRHVGRQRVHLTHLRVQESNRYAFTH